MKKIAIQRGHLYTTSPQTGTPGEQEAGRHISLLLQAELEKYRDVYVDLLNSALGGIKKRYDLFIALHCDGSNKKNVSGYSVGYPRNDMVSKDFADVLWATYGGSTGLRFRGLNITQGMSEYYGYSEINAGVKVLIEMGFLTNTSDKQLIMKDSAKVVNGIIAAIVEHFKLELKEDQPEPPGRKLLRLIRKGLVIGTEEDMLFLQDGKMCAPVTDLLKRLQIPFQVEAYPNEKGWAVKLS